MSAPCSVGRRSGTGAGEVGAELVGLCCRGWDNDGVLPKGSWTTVKVKEVGWATAVEFELLTSLCLQVRCQ